MPNNSQYAIGGYKYLTVEESSIFHVFWQQLRRANPDFTQTQWAKILGFSSPNSISNLMRPLHKTSRHIYLLVSLLGTSGPLGATAYLAAARRPIPKIIYKVKAFAVQPETPVSITEEPEISCFLDKADEIIEAIEVLHIVYDAYIAESDLILRGTH